MSSTRTKSTSGKPRPTLQHPRGIGGTARPQVGLDVDVVRAEPVPHSSAGMSVSTSVESRALDHQASGLA
jgi:hypothetical protein